MGLREDRWLSDRFGYPVRTLDDGDVPDPPVRGREFWQAKVPCSDGARVRELCAAGFFPASTALGLIHRGDGAGVAGDEVRDADPERDTAVLDVAASCFRFSRFHLDPLVTDEVANEIKREWIVSYLKGLRGDRLLVTGAVGSPDAFLAVIETPEAVVIDLLGVAPRSQRAGRGRALVAALLVTAAERGLPVRVATQAANLPGTRFYERAGFVLDDAWFDMHRHIGA